MAVPMTTSISIRRESIINQLELWRGNLNAAEEQAAHYGINVPLPLHNEIENAKKEIERLEALLAQSNGNSQIDVQIDNSFDAMVSTIGYLQKRIDFLMSSWMEDHRRVDIMWRKDHPSVKHRMSLVTAGLFVILALSIWYIKDFRDVLIAAPILGAMVTFALLAVAPLAYFFGRDDYDHE